MQLPSLLLSNFLVYLGKINSIYFSCKKQKAQKSLFTIQMSLRSVRADLFIIMFSFLVTGDANDERDWM